MLAGGDAFRKHCVPALPQRVIDGARQAGFAAAIITAMPALNAVPGTVAAEPGVITANDIPTAVGAYWMAA